MRVHWDSFRKVYALKCISAVGILRALLTLVSPGAHNDVTGLDVVISIVLVGKPVVQNLKGTQLVACVTLASISLAFNHQEAVFGAIIV